MSYILIINLITLEAFDIGASPSRCVQLITLIWGELFTSGIGKYPKMPNVRYLHLRHTNQFSEGPPNSCIAACSNSLTTLYTADSICAELLDVLHRPSLYDTLEILHLDRGHGRERVPFRVLRKFTKLRDLLLPTNLIYNGGSPPLPWFPPTDPDYYEETINGILPPNLVNLYLLTEADAQDRMEADLYRIIKRKHILQPILESITTNVEIWDMALIRLFDDAGIKLVCRAEKRRAIYQVLDL